MSLTLLLRDLGGLFGIILLNRGGEHGYRRENPVELEAAVYRRLVEHLRSRTDVQNIDLMNLAGFCRNCLSNWMKDAADAKGVPMTKEQSREIVYGMPYDQWRAKYQKEASAEPEGGIRKSKPKALRPVFGAIVLCSAVDERARALT